MELSALPDAASHHLYPAFVEMLEPAVTDGSPAFIDGIDTMWIAYEGGTVWGAATTRLRTDDTAELRLAGGGRFRDWMGLLDEAVSQWAVANGKSRIAMVGRRGWARFANAYGWVALGTNDEGKVRFEKALAGRER